MQTLCPFYFNPFFPGCKGNFKEMAKFFENFPKRTGKNRHMLPKCGKKRSEPPPKTALPPHSAQYRCGKISHPQIGSAHGKAVIQIHPPGAKGKHRIPNRIPFSAQWAQSAMEKSQPNPQQ